MRRLTCLRVSVDPRLQKPQGTSELQTTAFSLGRLHRESSDTYGNTDMIGEAGQLCVAQVDVISALMSHQTVAVWNSVAVCKVACPCLLLM